MELSRKLGLDEDAYSISIPLGATVNMAGAAITISWRLLQQIPWILKYLLLLHLSCVYLQLPVRLVHPV